MRVRYEGLRIGDHLEVIVHSPGKRESLPMGMFFGPFEVEDWDWGHGLTMGCLKLTADIMAHCLKRDSIALWAVILVAENLWRDQSTGPWFFDEAELVIRFDEATNVQPWEKQYVREVASE